MKAQVLTGVAAATLLTGIVSSAGIANAASLSLSASYQQTDLDKQEVPDPYLSQGYGLTDIEAPISIGKFDSALGTLKSVTLSYSGSMKGQGGIENRSGTARSVSVNLSGLLSLSGPNNTNLFQLNPQKNVTYSVAGYDRTLDYDGTSGRTFEGLTADTSGTQVFTDTNILQSFTGSGMLDFLFTATAESQVIGSGNISSFIDTFAKADLNVTYDYDPTPIPEPSAMLGLAGVLGGMALQKKKAMKKA
jgi:hypothetical protein